MTARRPPSSPLDHIDSTTTAVRALNGVNVRYPRQVTAIMGPSGSRHEPSCTTLPRPQPALQGESTIARTVIAQRSAGHAGARDTLAD